MPPLFRGNALPVFLTLKASRAINPNGNIIAHLTCGNHIQILNTKRGFSHMHKLLDNNNVRVTLTCRASSPSPPPGCEYNNLNIMNDATVAASDEKSMVECVDDANVICDQLGCVGVQSKHELLCLSIYPFG